MHIYLSSYLPISSNGHIHITVLASFQGHLPFRSLDCIRELWTAWRSGRRPGASSTSSNRKVDSIMTYVD